MDADKFFDVPLRTTEPVVATERLLPVAVAAPEVKMVITLASCAVECDVGSGRGSIRASARARAPTKRIILNNSYAHDDQGDNPEQETES